MKLYMHPVSTTSRPIRLFAAENKIALDEEVVDLMTGAHHKEPYCSINPNRLVPALVDGDLCLTESSAILKYLADKAGSPTYPKDAKRRAQVNEAMDWFNTNLYRDFAYGLVYPQIFPNHKRENDAVQTATIAWGKKNSEKWLKTLDEHWLGRGKPFLCGDAITIADYFGACLLTVGDTIGCDFSGYPNIARWLSRMRALPSWSKVNEALDGFTAHLKGQAFESIRPN